MTTTHLLYLHGFRSSPQSAKARLMAQHMAQHFPDVVWYCPALPPSPRAAMEMVRQATADWPGASMAVVGSSLGGFYATWVAEQRGCKAVLLNPAVYPARDLKQYIGAQTQWHAPDEAFYFQPHYVKELEELACGELTDPGRYFCILARGDEVLDWREMQARYAATQMLLLDGGDHALSNFAELLPQVLAHLMGGPAI
jgi:predicted esterase YcpF (UPF0227 family)